MASAIKSWLLHVRILWLKRRARLLYLRWIADGYGPHFLRNTWFAKQFNQTMDELAKIDPNAPKKRLPED